MDTSFSERVTISFDPAVDEQQEVLKAVTAVFLTAAANRAAIAAVVNADLSDQSVDGWTAESMHRYIAALKPVARKVLLAVVTASPPCEMSYVKECTGLSERRYAEAHDSLQEALRVVPEVGRLPFDVVDDCFLIDEEVAELVSHAFDRIAKR